jgi:hypothetical protein
VLAADTPKGRQWADRALERIREEAEAIGVSLNGKTSPSPQSSGVTVSSARLCLLGCRG